MILYQLPDSWIKYDLRAIQLELVEAKSALTALRTMPYQRSCLESLQQMELKREVAGTSRIEGAEFAERELEEALKESPEQLFTRSQRPAPAAVNTYRWIAALEQDRPIDSSSKNSSLCPKPRPIPFYAKLCPGASLFHAPPYIYLI